jgi:hypothetical protein
MMKLHRVKVRINRFSANELAVGNSGSAQLSYSSDTGCLC